MLRNVLRGSLASSRSGLPTCWKYRWWYTLPFAISCKATVGLTFPRGGTGVLSITRARNRSGLIMAAA